MRQQWRPWPLLSASSPCWASSSWRAGRSCRRRCRGWSAAQSAAHPCTQPGPVRCCVHHTTCRLRIRILLPSLHNKDHEILREHLETFWCGSGSGFGSGSCYLRHWPSRRQRKTNPKKVFLLITFWRYIYIIFKDKKSKRSHKTVGIKVFLTIFAWLKRMIEGSGSIPLTNGSGSGRPKNMSIRWIRVRNTATATAPYIAWREIVACSAERAKFDNASTLKSFYYWTLRERIRTRIRSTRLCPDLLKVGGNEKQCGSGRSQMLGTG